jgi:hypothetical protein
MSKVFLWISFALGSAYFALGSAYFALGSAYFALGSVCFLQLHALADENSIAS